MYQRPRIIPCLTIQDNDLVKTTQFKNPRYIGDPVNSVKIFNDKGVDELCILDINASKQNKEPNYQLLQEIANEAFMPLSYGGGLKTLDQVKRIIKMGYEKVVFNTSFIIDSQLIKDTVNFLGSSGVVISIDVKKNMFGKYVVYINDGSQEVKMSLIDVIKLVEDLDAGEIIINSITNDGMMEGYDLSLIKLVSESVSVPVIAIGGAKDVSDLKKAIENGAHAVAASSMFIYYGKQKAVLITVPELSQFKVKQ
ncbi:MAG TPA: imidazole glycerol phosphate synthase subunit HisF [Erysipelotrichaceae bacterium]|nr:imidazole glycerol phosphate synthase subunit HisF [Erysipelotrichaceae bacterium]